MQYYSTGWQAMVCSMLATRGVSGPSGFELIQPGCPFIRTTQKNWFFSSLGLLACVSSLSLHSVQHAAWGPSGCMVADSGLMTGPLLSWGTISRFHPAFPTPLCGRPPLQTAPSQSSRKKGGTPLPFSPVSANSVEWEFCHPFPPEVAQHGHTITACSILSR